MRPPRVIGAAVGAPSSLLANWMREARRCYLLRAARREKFTGGLIIKMVSRRSEVRANVFRFTLKLGHRLMQSACLKVGHF